MVVALGERHLVTRIEAHSKENQQLGRARHLLCSPLGFGHLLLAEPPVHSPYPPHLWGREHLLPSLFLARAAQEQLKSNAEIGTWFVLSETTT